MDKLMGRIIWCFNWIFKGNQSSRKASKSEELRKIHANLADIPDTQRTPWAARIFHTYVYALHDTHDPQRALERLRIAATLKDEYGLKLDNEYFWSKLVQFVRSSEPVIYALPPEGLALIKYLAISTTPGLTDFLREETAKVKILGHTMYMVDEIHPPLETERVSVRHHDGPLLEDDGFDPLNPKTWKK